MLKKELTDIFLELLEEWENSEEIIINDRGDISEYEELEERKNKYLIKFNGILNDIQ
ncbi:hypothetical protein [Inconstantimicrobium mannanitabidum]|uniref:Uncharacterized protein n=1 Tax=Inconstantimicrobium mannanitabidum TaxID=1604901 RepID=A0ACB5R9R2_9CLOT|nr:hypothetical protein [Clostridium sp. TW13]GKX65845.1 hypothetical protein rsdtw13_11030 [Clostridium sp. TW13]